MEHSFNVEIARDHGVIAAILLKNIGFWIAKNKANKRHYHNDRYWTYNSIMAFDELFPYLSYKQIRTALDKLRESGVIETRNYNKSGHDRTLWYTIADDKIYNMSTSSIGPYGQIELPVRANGNAPEGKSLSYIKPDIKLDSSLSPQDKEKDMKRVAEQFTDMPKHLRGGKV